VVAVLVGLKLRLLRNALRQSAWRIVGVVLATAYGLFLVALAVVGMIALRFTGVAVGPDVVVVGLSALTLGWTLVPLLASGMDDTLDPGRFALLPLRARELLPGLVASSLVGVPGVATVLIALASVVFWATGALPAIAALIGAVLGVLTSVVLARVVTTGLGGLMGGRRFRDSAAGIVAVLASLSGVTVAMGMEAVSRTPNAADLVGSLAALAGWTPFGWAWSLPADVASGRWGSAAAKLGCAVVLVAGLLRAWEALLERRLTSPLEARGGGERVGQSGWIDRLVGTSSAGAVAGRCLRYWRRDPRYITSIAMYLILPIVLVVSMQLQRRSGDDLGAVPWEFFGPFSLAMLVGLSTCQDLAYDGTAVWTHLTTGVPGRADRLGRLIALGVVVGPLFVLLQLAAAVISGRWDLVVPSTAVGAAAGLGGAGAASWIGAILQSPAAPAGANPFRTTNGGGLQAMIATMVTVAASGILAVPVLALAWAGLDQPWAAVAAPVVGLGIGLGAVTLGTRLGGGYLDGHWPEVLTNVSEKRA
jgi:ABC-2 type transport system permease protein